MSDMIEGGGGAAKPEADLNALPGNESSPMLAPMTEGDVLWTLADMEAAQPCDIIEIDEDALAQEIESLQAQELLDGGSAIAGGEPQLDVEADEEVQATQGGYNYPGPFTRFEVTDAYTEYPLRTIGKLFFKRNGRSFVCSAASIGGDAIWTAGHCLHAGNNKRSGWATNVVFVPAYRDGKAPYGQWRVKQMWVRTAWYRHGISKGLAQDMGGAIVYPRNGRRLSQTVGWLGFAWNMGRFQHWNQLGYPAAKPFNGQRLICAQSSYAYDGSVGASPKPVGVGSDLTGGSSGGPWIVRFETANYLNGNNSYRRRSKPQEMFSPYFNGNAKSLYDQLRKAKA